jgi:hypothetical protein
MAFCSKCGNKNDEDAAFCKSCGAPIPPATVDGKPPMYPPGHEMDRRGMRQPRPKDFDKECEDECSKGGKQHTWFWGVVVVLIGIFIIFEAGIKNIEGLPDAVYDVQLWWVIPLLIGIMIISAGLRVISR